MTIYIEFLVVVCCPLSIVVRSWLLPSPFVAVVLELWCLTEQTLIFKDFMSIARRKGHAHASSHTYKPSVGSLSRRVTKSHGDNQNP